MTQKAVKLQYTPRRFLFDDISKMFVIIESENCVNSFSKRAELGEELDSEYFGFPRTENGNWASCIRLLSPLSGESSDLLEFENNEAAVRF
jgi:splicing factor 3B subunit 3